MGKAPLTERLDQLTIDVSTMSEVKAILGEPQGRGAVKSPSFGLKEAWLYESTEMKGMDMTSELRMLMVFLDKNRGVYHGHLWFSSGYLFDQIQ
jgi:hypothetical protein